MNLVEKLQTIYLEKLMMENEFNKKEDFYCVIFELYEKDLDNLKQQLKKNKELNVDFLTFSSKITETNKNGKKCNNILILLRIRIKNKLEM